jgi:hypothetical protein
MAERRPEAYSAVVTGAGRAVVTIRPPRLQRWIVSQVSVEMPTGPVGSTCALRLNGRMVTPLISTGDVASGEPYTTVYPTDQLTVEWDGCTPGDVGTVLMFYTEEKTA